METNKGIALRALLGVFVDRDPSVVTRYFADNYIQHNPTIRDGSRAMAGLIASLAPELSYELGMTVAEGDIVMIYGRYVGWQGKTVIAVDIFRVAHGRVAEHWDVLQEEVPTAQTASGNPMFTLRT